MSRGTTAVVQAQALTPQGVSGDLHHEAGHYEFRYSGNTPDVAVSLTMPVRRDQYRATQLLPIFQQSLPEGFVLEQLRLRLAKLTQLDPMLLLSLTGHDGAIGRLCVQSPAVQRLLGSAQTEAKGGTVRYLLAWDGTENLFTELVERYLLRTGVSGVQPEGARTRAGRSKRTESHACGWRSDREKRAGPISGVGHQRIRLHVDRACRATLPCLSSFCPTGTICS